MAENLVALIDGLSAIRLADTAARSLETIDYIVLAGASCAGKTTLIRAAKAELMGQGAWFPVRLTTRAPRPDDDPEEQISVSPDDLEAELAAGELLLAWDKPMDGGRVERYGFRRSEGVPAVLSGNEALVSSPDNLSQLNGKALLVAVEASQGAREARLRARSPELFAERPEEAAHRLLPAKPLPGCHLIISNEDGKEAPEQFTELVRRISNGIV